MAKRRQHKKRQHRLIAFKVFEDSDQDILDWWEDIEEGQRSDAIRDVLREFLDRQSGRQSRPRKEDSLTEFARVRDDTTWIREALNDMPSYLEQIIQRVVTAQPAAVVVSGGPPVQPGPGLSAQDKSTREANMRKRTW